ncbi:MAG: hypothetical protein ACHP78_03005 [Terriglobales bacterium]
MAREVTLGDFVKQLAALMSRGEGTVLLFKDETPWHLLFYHLQNQELPGKPQFLANLRFDWLGPKPKCRELSRYIQWLHLTECVGTQNPSYETMVLDPELRELWLEQAQQQPKELVQFLQTAAELGKQQFQKVA